MRLPVVLAIASTAFATPASAQSVAVGTYLCTVEQQAGIGSTHHSTLHSVYIGDGRAFTAEDAPGILNFGRDRWGATLQFYHAGFQYAGGEDESLAVRWGRCASE